MKRLTVYYAIHHGMVLPTRAGQSAALTAAGQLRARMRRPGERRTYGQQLLAEHAAYYAKQPLVLPGPAQRLGGVEKYQLVQGQRVRKRDHRERAARLRADMI